VAHRGTAGPWAWRVGAGKAPPVGGGAAGWSRDGRGAPGPGGRHRGAGARRWVEPPWAGQGHAAGAGRAPPGGGAGAGTPAGGGGGHAGGTGSRGRGVCLWRVCVVCVCVACGEAPG